MDLQSRLLVLDNFLYMKSIALSGDNRKENILLVVGCQTFYLVLQTYLYK